MRIDNIELDDRNTFHLTKHGVSPDEVIRVFMNRPAIRRNKKDSTGTYYAVAFGVRVNFIYDGATSTARPVSAWRI